MATITIPQKKTRTGFAAVALALIAAMGIVYAFAYLIPHTTLPDWRVFWDSSAMLDNPYARFGFLNPYWSAWILAPLHLFTNDYLVGYGLWSFLTLATVVFVFRDDKFLVIASIASPYFMHQIINGQIDAIVIVGYYLLTQSEQLQSIAPALMLVKPQSMIGALVVWGVNNIHEKIVWQAAAILAILAGIGFALYGNWPLAMYNNIQNGLYQGVNASWAFNYPLVGIGLLILGIWRKNVFLGGLGTLFLTPYIAMHSLWVYWTAWLMEKPNKYLVVLLVIVNWCIALRFTA